MPAPTRIRTFTYVATSAMGGISFCHPATLSAARLAYTSSGGDPMWWIVIALLAITLQERFYSP